VTTARLSPQVLDELQDAILMSSPLPLDLSRRHAIAGPSCSRTVIVPPMTDLVEELMTYQRTMPSWKAWERETVGWKGMAEENIKMYIGVDSAE
jgi:hypothetical protein